MIISLGIDVASVARMQQALDRFGDRFSARILTPREQKELSARADRAIYLAGRFAAKEALSKALGAPRDVWWQDVEVHKGPLGAPVLELRGAASLHAERLGVKRSLISITHDAGVAAAVVVLDSEVPGKTS
jgi:holo-[acyl-carrier protein] synthase